MKTAIVFLLTLFPTLLFAQQKRYKLAEELFSKGAYADAAQVYEDVLARKTDSATVSEHISIAYDKSGNSSKALDWYHWRNLHATLDKEGAIRYSLLLCSDEQYERAEGILDLATMRFGSDARTEQLKKELIRFRKQGKRDDLFEIKTQTGNSEKSEMSVIPISESKVMFSSTRNQRVAVRRYHALNNEPLYDLFLANADSTGFSKVRRLNENTKYHDGSACFDSINGILYFTRNNYINGQPQRDVSGTMLLKILCGKMVDGKLEDVVELPFNSNAYSCAHPSVSSDGKTLIFTSNMPGSIGGMDLFAVTKDENGVFGTPYNLGSSINTVMDELFPFFHQQDQIVFFASNGHYGHGGLDIFAAKMNPDMQARDIINLGKSINSPADDFAFINDKDQRRGYIASNRKGGVGDDDLYAFKQLKPIKSSAIVSGTVTDLITRSTLPDARIIVVDQNGTIIDTVLTDSTGNYSIELPDSELSYTLEVSKPGYVPQTRTISPEPNKDSYTADFQLMPVLNYFISGTIHDKDTRETISDVAVGVVCYPENQRFAKTSDQAGHFVTETVQNMEYGDTLTIVLTLVKTGYVPATYTVKKVLDLEEEIVVNTLIDPVLSKIAIGNDLGELAGLNPIYYDYRKWNIRKDAATELDKIVKIMLENPNMKIELGSHTDSRGDDNSNKSLSQKRAKSAVDYIISKGVNASRISAKGYGESILLISDQQIKVMTADEKERAHQRNRRTEFRVVSL